MRAPAAGLVAVVVVAAVSAPRGAAAQSVESARLLGLGQAQRALTTHTDAIYLNPAGIAMGKTYVLEGTYLDDFRGSDRRINGAVIDSQAGPIAAGFAYTYTSRRPDDVDETMDGAVRLDGHRAEAAVATRVGDSAGVGFNVRYMAFERLDGDALIPDSDFKVFTMDAGLQWRLGPGLSLGLVGYNLIRNERPETPIQLGGGIGYQVSILSVETDVLYGFDAQNVQVSGSASVVLAEMLPIRVGVSWDENTDEWRLSGGVGVFAPTAGIDVGYRQSLNPRRSGDDRDDRVFGASVYLVLF